jgi:threonine/homoserine/homoserine lactone efflux protein
LPPSPVFVIVRWAGAAYLLYIAWKFWSAKPGSEQMKPKSEDALKTFLAGFSLTMGNPKTIVFYLAILPTVVPLGEMNPLAFAELTAIVVICLLIVGCAYAWLASAAREMFRSEKALGRLNKTAGAMMAGAAGLVVFQH